jgi:hypothetical protein
MRSLSTRALNVMEGHMLPKTKSSIYNNKQRMSRTAKPEKPPNTRNTSLNEMKKRTILMFNLFFLCLADMEGSLTVRPNNKHRIKVTV